ncbi:MAG TPA: zinc ribbon domain-containing protein [Actinobacteria bacterium]|nr:zinc ribbon domain-containing protein [Actinomycetes bacterium]HEX21788.1 zinc ribbon domain-containing protein [Actinomycetota bacterium]
MNSRQGAKYCRKCGAQINKEYAYCQKCGTEVRIVPVSDGLAEPSAKLSPPAQGIKVTTVFPIIIGLFLMFIIVGTVVFAYVNSYVLDKENPQVFIDGLNNGEKITLEGDKSELKKRIEFTAVDNKKVVKAELYIDGNKVKTFYNKPYEYDWRTATTGRYTIRAKAYDRAGNVGKSKNISVVVLAKKTQPAPAAAPISSPDNQRSDSVVPTKLYENSSYIFSLEYPENWSVQEKQYSAEIFRVTFQDPNSDAKFFIDCRTLSADEAAKSPMQNLLGLEKVLSKQYSGYQRELMEPTSVNGLDGAKWIFEVTTSDKGRQKRQDLNFRYSDYYDYAILFSAAPEQYDEKVAVFQHALDSFAIND